MKDKDDKMIEDDETDQPMPSNIDLEPSPEDVPPLKEIPPLEEVLHRKRISQLDEGDDENKDVVSNQIIISHMYLVALHEEIKDFVDENEITCINYVDDLEYIITRIEDLRAHYLTQVF